MTCTAEYVELPRKVTGIRLANSLVELVLLPYKGGDFYEWRHRKSGVDVLWKSPWGLRHPGGGTPSAFETHTSWSEYYEGGWQLLFPNAGEAGEYKGALQSFHGESSAMAWDVDDLHADDSAATLSMSVRLSRSPFLVERKVTLPADSGAFTVWERITNKGGQALDYLWGHHPAYGSPFLDAGTRIYTNASTIVAAENYDPDGNPMNAGASYSWPLVNRDGVENDLSRLPGPGSGQVTMGFFVDLPDETTWYALVNHTLKVGAGLVWESADFSHPWFWQELNGSPDFPWYKEVYVMAIEPNTSWPGGLVNVMNTTKTHRTIEAGDSVEVSFTAVLFDATGEVTGIAEDGTVTQNQVS